MWIIGVMSIMWGNVSNWGSNAGNIVAHVDKFENYKMKMFLEN